MKKNPFRGIAVANQTHERRFGAQKAFRHVDGARDWRPSWLARKYSFNDGSVKDANPVPVSFLE